MVVVVVVVVLVVARWAWGWRRATGDQGLAQLSNQPRGSGGFEQPSDASRAPKWRVALACWVGLGWAARSWDELGLDSLASASRWLPWPLALPRCLWALSSFWFLRIL